MSKLKLLANTILILLCIVGYIVIHEYTHAQIYAYYGCQDVEISITLIGGQTQCKDIENLAYPEEVLRLQSIVDAIGYQLLPIYVILLLILVTLWERK